MSTWQQREAALRTENEQLRAEIIALRSGMDGVDQLQARIDAQALGWARTDIARLRAALRGTCAAISAFCTDDPENAYMDSGTRRVGKW
jgi:hypothetical protein